MKFFMVNFGDMARIDSEEKVEKEEEGRKTST